VTKEVLTTGNLDSGKISQKNNNCGHNAILIRWMKHCCRPGLPDFYWYNILKRGKIYQITMKYTKWRQSIPNGRKIDQTAINYTNVFHFKTLQNLPKNGIFGLKTNHLATLLPP
jgi:hypothetical protein